MVMEMVPESEIGQGVHTGLAMVLAEELDADCARVSVEHPPIDKIYNRLATLVEGLPFHPDDTGAVKKAAGWLTVKDSQPLRPAWRPARAAARRCGG